MTYHIHDIYGADVCPACTPALAPVPLAVSAARYRRRLRDRLDFVLNRHLQAHTGVYSVETYNMALRVATFLWGCDVAPVAVSLAVWQGKRNGTRAARAVLRRVETMHAGEHGGESKS